MKRILLTVALLVATGLCASAAPPDFSGKWVLNIAKSEFGEFLPLTKLTDDIVQTATELKIQRTQANEDREVNSEIIYKFGEDSVAKLPSGESHTRVHWEGSVLVVELQISTTIHLRVLDRWTLLKDGHTLQIVRQYGNEQGSTKQTLVLEKQ